MTYEPIKWDSVPDVMSKDQFYKLCHISKSTARYLLQTGKVPCRYTGKKTRCYQIRKEDVQTYLRGKGICPELYLPQNTKRKTKFPALTSKELPEKTQKALKGYLLQLMKDYPDVMSGRQVAKLIGYGPTTVHQWCRKGELYYIQSGGSYYIPKAVLIDFICSMRFRTIHRKSQWHIVTMMSFHKEMDAHAKQKEGK